MNREIKFRAQDFTHSWNYGFVAKGNAEGVESAVIFPVADNGTVFLGVQIEVLPDTIGQYTGMHDKNGKEIYEGDIIKHPYVDPIFRDLVEPKEGDCVTSEVVFHNGAFVVKYTENDFIYLDAFTRYGYVEVVGNIYDNFDLMK